MIDIRQFCQTKWDNQKPPFSWKDIDRYDARGFIVYLQKKEISASTICRKISALRSFFSFLMEEQIIEKNPFVGLNSPKKNKPLPKVLSIEEVKRLLEVPLKIENKRNFKSKVHIAWVSYMGIRDSAILELLYSTGMRINELVSLSEENIDLISGTVIVRGKGKKERLCPLGKYAEKAIQKAVDSRDNLCFYLIKKLIQSVRYLLTRQGDALSPRSIERMMKSI